MEKEIFSWFSFILQLTRNKLSNEIWIAETLADWLSLSLSIPFFGEHGFALFVHDSLYIMGWWPYWNPIKWFKSFTCLSLFLWLAAYALPSWSSIGIAYPSLSSRLLLPFSLVWENIELYKKGITCLSLNYHETGLVYSCLWIVVQFEISDIFCS